MKTPVAPPAPHLPRIVSPAAWRKARTAFLRREKAFTRARDAHQADLRRLPMVEVTTAYRFDGPDGPASLLDLFDGRHQLIIYHFMWRWRKDRPLKDGCPSCSAWADHLARGHLNGLRARDTNLVLVSRAPLARIRPFQRRMGWTVPWYSSAGSRFNYDFHVSFDEAITPLVYNYRPKAAWRGPARAVMSQPQPFDLHGISCFLRVDALVYHTYSTYGRGTEAVGGTHYFLDHTALGRQEPWERPKGRSWRTGIGAGSGRLLFPDGRAAK